MGTIDDEGSGGALWTRRRVVGAMGSMCAVGGVARVAGGTSAASAGDAAVANAPANPAVTTSADAADAQAIARDEAFWADVGAMYDRTDGIVNLEHGYWGRLARPVQARYLEATDFVNRQGAWYARKDYADDHREAVRRVAAALGVHADEIALTRNATESVHNLVRQYQGLKPGDQVLYADIDYPPFKRLMADLKTWRGVEPVTVTLPPRASAQEILALYRDAFERHERLRLMLLTHASNQHGLVLPVREIAAAARARGIHVVCDAAQSWGLVDYRLPSLGVDWAAFNLHKWIGAPLGLGALYMRRGSLESVAPYPGEADPTGDKIYTRVHSGTSNFAAVLAIPTALDVHETIGGARKEARLRYLRSLWTDTAERLPHIEVLGGADEASWSGIGALRLAGQTGAEQVRALQRRLEEEFGVFTVIRTGLASGACLRVTPQVFTRPAEVEALVDALRRLRV